MKASHWNIIDKTVEEVFLKMSSSRTHTVTRIVAMCLTFKHEANNNNKRQIRFCNTANIILTAKSIRIANTWTTKNRKHSQDTRDILITSYAAADHTYNLSAVLRGTRNMSRRRHFIARYTGNNVSLICQLGLIGWIETREVNEHSTVLSVRNVPINSANNLHHYL